MHTIVRELNEEKVTESRSQSHSRRSSSDFRSEIAGKRVFERLRLIGERQADPELNLANERSFVRWAHIALYLLAIGGALIRQVQIPLRLAGIITMMYACFLVVRAAVRHRLRIKVLRKSEGQNQVDDAFLENWSPQLYGAVLIFLLIVLGGVALLSTFPDIVRYINPSTDPKL